MLTLLVLYNVLFFWKFYNDPFYNSTGELLSTHFPHWTWIGRKIRSKNSFLKDEIYYYEPDCIPFLSSFYPIHLLTALVGSFFNLDNKFRLLHYSILIHYILGSFLSYFMFLQWFSPLVSLFGGLTIAYMGASQRVQNPCIAYTMAWIPGCFIAGPMSGIALGMAILSGYWPTLIYMLPFILLNQYEAGSWWVLMGFLIGLPQIIPFLFYWPRSIRHKQQVDKKFGSVPFWRFFNQEYRGYINGVLFFESTTGLGLCYLFALYSTSRAYLICLLCASMASGKFKVPFRVPARFIYPFSFFMVWMACSGLNSLNIEYNQMVVILLVQGFILLKNANLYPLWPFTEWQRKPSEWFEKEIHDITQFPYFTGYITNTETNGYTGGFSLKSTCLKNGVTNPNGERV